MVLIGTRPSMCQDEPVKVVVGIVPDRTTWYIHRMLMIEHSPYFRAALGTDQFVESNSNFVFLPEDDSIAFGLFVQWIYAIGIARPFPRFTIVAESDCLNIVKAYCLGDKLGAIRFKNDILLALARAMVKANRSLLTPESILYAFEHTVNNSGLRTMLADILAQSIEDGTIKLSGNTSEDLTWSEFFNSGGKYISAVLGRFVGGNVTKTWMMNKRNHVEYIEEKLVKEEGVEEEHIVDEYVEADGFEEVLGHVGIICSHQIVCWITKTLWQPQAHHCLSGGSTSSPLR